MADRRNLKLRWAWVGVAVALIAAGLGCDATGKTGGELTAGGEPSAAAGSASPSDTTSASGSRANAAPTVLGYTLAPPFSRNVKTIAVEMFDSREFRRQFEFKITEAVAKRLELETPWKIVPAARADTLLTGELISITVASLNEEPNTGAVRTLQVGHAVRWTWKDQRTGRILFRRDSKLPEIGYTLNYPQFNESVQVALNQAVDDVARHVVASLREDF